MYQAPAHLPAAAPVRAADRSFALTGAGGQRFTVSVAAPRLAATPAFARPSAAAPRVAPSGAAGGAGYRPMAASLVAGSVVVADGGSGVLSTVAGWVTGLLGDAAGLVGSTLMTVGGVLGGVLLAGTGVAWLVNGHHLVGPVGNLVNTARDIVNPPATSVSTTAPSPSATVPGGMPNVVGMNLEDATDLLRKAGYRHVSRVAVDGRSIWWERHWTVAAQEPAAGGPVSKESKIVLSVTK